jgi:hypothetical protein
MGCGWRCAILYRFSREREWRPAARRLITRRMAWRPSVAERSARRNSRLARRRSEIESRRRPRRCARRMRALHQFAQLLVGEGLPPRWDRRETPASVGALKCQPSIRQLWRHWELHVLICPAVGGGACSLPALFVDASLYRRGMYFPDIPALAVLILELPIGHRPSLLKRVICVTKDSHRCVMLLKYRVRSAGLK